MDAPMNTADPCPRCQQIGRWAEAEGALFPQTRTCSGCDELQRRCADCYGWFPETALVVVDRVPTCADCRAMAEDYARRDAHNRLAEIESILMDMRGLLEEAQQELERVRHAS